MRSATIILFSVALLSVYWRSADGAVCPGAGCSKGRGGGGGVINRSRINVSQANEVTLQKEHHNAEIGGTQHIITNNTDVQNTNKKIHEITSVKNDHDIRVFNKIGGTKEIKTDLNTFGLAKFNRSRNEEHNSGGGGACIVC